MTNKNKERWIITLVVVAIYFLLSISFSIIQQNENACDKTYPINYIFYSRLFCEIKDDK